MAKEWEIIKHHKYKYRRIQKEIYFDIGTIMMAFNKIQIEET